MRPRLNEKLKIGLGGKLTLVSAPAGFGKTTLISAFSTQETAIDETVIAWLSVDDADNDPTRFLTYFSAALATAGLDLALEETAVSTGSRQTVSNTPPDLFMTDVINSATRLLSPITQLIFVLDDYHLIQNRMIHEAITFLLEHMPANMHLVLTTRADPPLPLARWRARSQLVEVRQEDLRFTAKEAADFLNQIMSLSLTAEDVETLNRRTEGWIAGLQMAAVSLRDRPDVNFVQNFSGSHRHILDYLMEEVLLSQPEGIKQFLLKTAVLERLCAPLCDEILEISDWRLETKQAPVISLQSQQILEHLETANLFIISLDEERQWYRYHRLFADLLRQRLAQTEPAQIPILHERASVWFEANGFLEEAIHHALLAGTADKAAGLIEQMAETMLMRSELVTLMRWLTALPETELAKRPLLSFYYAWALIMEGRSQAEVETVLRYIQAEGASSEMALVSSLRALLYGDGTTAVALAQEALTQLDSEQTFLQAVTTWVLGLALLFRGDLDQGVQTLEQAVAISQEAGNLTIAAVSLGRLANQAWRGGDLHRARRIYEQVLVLATDEAERPLPIAGEAHIGLARIYFEWNDLEAARQHAETGLALTERWREVSAVAGYIWLARIQQIQGQPEDAANALDRARQIARQSEGTQFDDMAVDISDAFIQLLQGDFKKVESLCTSWDLPEEVDTGALKQRDDLIEGHLRKYQFTILARLRLAQRCPAEALALLLPVLSDVQRQHRCDLQIENHILTALAYEQIGDKAQADYHLNKALTLGEPGGFVRMFIEAGAGEILKRQKEELERMKDEGGRMKDYLQKLLAAFDQSTPSTAQSLIINPQSSLVEPLSERELEVLTLIAEGLSNREIAAELVLSLPTIKWHTSNIYGKLGVGNRTTAVARARELQILP
jgi:LuxR family maltose regulon positive regulatory protein